MKVLEARCGVEIELLAPRGSSRRVLADVLAANCEGTVRPVWHADSEPSLVPGLGRFLHLTQGFAVDRPDGSPLCTLVDDITISADLDPRAPSPPGWHRVLTDDARLLHLLARHSDPGATLVTVLSPVAALWGMPVEEHGAVRRLTDAGGGTVALAAPQGGERERPCEIVTPPLAGDHLAALEELLAPARDLGFTVPTEAAVHLHLDGGPYRAPAVLANVVRLFGWWRTQLWQVLGTNNDCRRLAPLPTGLLVAVEGAPSYADLQAAADRGGLTKFSDVNLVQLFRDRPLRDTLEVRLLPGTLSAGDIVDRAVLVEELLRRCRDPEPLAPPPSQDGTGDSAEAATEALCALAVAGSAQRLAS